jgi:hypothetical protein
MIKYQFIFAISFLLSISACQNDSSIDNANTAGNKVTEATEKAVSDIKNEVKEAAKPKLEVPESPKLREFYVEEAKSKEEPKKRSSKTRASEKSGVTSDKAAATTDTKSAAKPKAKKSPNLKFTNNTYAFGIIKPGDVIEHKFEFTNTGSADLVITDAKATCGCTQPSFPFVPIPPGEKGYIGVKYDSTGKLGSQKPTVTLTTNAYPKTQKVYLEGVVISELAKKQ